MSELRWSDGGDEHRLDDGIGDDVEQGPVPVLAVVGRPERRQVDAGQPHPRPPRGGRRGRARRDPRPGAATTRPGTAGGSPSSTPAAGSRTRRACQAQVAAQAEIAIAAADAVLFVVDATVGATDTDEAVVRVLRRAGKPVVLVANKVDDAKTEADAAALWSLGLGEPYPVSALHGRGSGDLLDAVLAALPETPGGALRRGSRARAGSRCSAGPTSASPVLLNQLAGEDRVVVDSVAGHHPRPGRRADRARRRDLAVRRHRGHPPPGQAGQRHRLLRDAAHPVGAGPRRGRRRPHRRQRAAVRAGHPHHLDGGRVRPRPGHRLQQVGPARRRAPLLPRARDRARPGAGAVGAAGQHLGPHRPAHGEAGARAGHRAGVVGHAGSRPAGSTRSSASWSPPTRTRSAAASSRGSCSPPRPTPGRRGSCCSRPASSRPATGGSSSAGCARSSASSVRRSRSASGCARSAAADRQADHRTLRQRGSTSTTETRPSTSVSNPSWTRTPPRNREICRACRRFSGLSQ